MEFANRLDIFEPGDLTALVCTDVPEVQRLVVDQLTSLNYKLHTGLFIEDILLKLRAHTYDVVLISENFAATDLESNSILREATRAPSVQRRKQLLVLIGATLQTNDDLQAFQHSVDLVVNLADVMNLRPVLRRALLRTQEFYAPFNDGMRAAGML
jgi:CheY-like chemotaxis protein